jgi:hypothetical protein
LSYRANVADLVIDYWGGIFGKYPSQLFVYTLSEDIEEYTKGELRELRSLPIELSETEKLGFIHQAQEQYWAYLGRYYFLSNNCATEACDLLQSTQNEESELHRIRSISPLGLYDELIRRGAVSAKVLEPRSVAIEKGFVFASYREKLNEAWTKLRQAGFAKQERLRTLDDYWLKLNAEQRFELWQKLPQKQSLASAFWLMETHVKRRLENQSYERALALLLEQKSLPKSADNEARQALDSLKETMLNPLPWSRLAETSRYGVPLVGELVQARDPARASSDLRQIYSEIQGFVSKLASREAEEIKRVEDNLRASSRALRRLDKGP